MKLMKDGDKKQSDAWEHAARQRKALYNVYAKKRGLFKRQTEMEHDKKGLTQSLFRLLKGRKQSQSVLTFQRTHDQLERQYLALRDKNNQFLTEYLGAYRKTCHERLAVTYRELTARYGALPDIGEGKYNMFTPLKALPKTAGSGFSLFRLGLTSPRQQPPQVWLSLKNKNKENSSAMLMPMPLPMTPTTCVNGSQRQQSFGSLLTPPSGLRRRNLPTDLDAKPLTAFGKQAKLRKQITSVGS